MHRFAVFLLTLTSAFVLHAQSTRTVSLKVKNESGAPLAGTSVEVLRGKDSSLVKIQMTDSAGIANFQLAGNAEYIWRISRVGHSPYVKKMNLPSEGEVNFPDVVLQSSAGEMTGITVSARKPFIELQAGKTVVNVEGSITSVGATAMEALEKMPGITVDKDGNISLKGKNSVNVMIDGKPTYLDASQLATLLNGMSASQISQVEIMENPPAKYDAAGNAGIINIKTKKTRQKGFNGSASTSYGQGKYPKNNNNLQFNYRNGNWNLFANYSMNYNRGFTRIYALRSYFQPDGKTIESRLEQPSMLKSKGLSHNVRLGADYFISAKTSVGVTVNGITLQRDGASSSNAFWLDANGANDSLIATRNTSHSAWKNAGANLNFKHSFSPSKELTADLDIIGYRIRGNQFFENNALQPVPYTEATRADLPSDIAIKTGKVDYTQQSRSWKWEAGGKTSHITTDNLADYEYLDANAWKPDYGKTNHFLYTENIHALYASGETNSRKWTVQCGLRFEATNYDAHQLGNIQVKDSSFSRSYNSLFPTFFASLAADSLNTFSLSAGRRIDRPAFQSLNPFVFIINKYTYQRGNPFYRPQYTWNLELSHSFRNMLITSLSYSLTKDFFSQVFPIDSNGIVTYTVGNLDRLQNFGLSMSLQVSPAKWWNLTTQAVLNHRRMEGFIEREYKHSMTQLNLNLNNQFRFKKGWSAELTGFYTSKMRNDIQEVVDPAGQVSVGVSKTVLKNKGSLKLAARDLFYTQWMKGLTYFTDATEYFKLTRDTRVVNLAFTYRFGKAFKTVKRSQGASGEEMQRVGNG